MRDLDQAVTIQAATNTKGAGGDDVAAWATVASCSAYIKASAKGGDETYDAGRDNAVEWYDVRIRRRAGLDSTMRIVWGDLTLEIRHVPPAFRGEYMTLKCRRVS